MSLADFLATFPQGAARPENEDPIPPWALDPQLQSRVRDRLAFERNQRPGSPTFPIGPGGVVGARSPNFAPPMPFPVGPGGVTGEQMIEPQPMPQRMQARFSSLAGDRPALGGAADWLGLRPPLAPDRIDAEPWRSPVETDRMAMGGPAPARGREPDSAPGTPQADDLDAAWNAALTRARRHRAAGGADRDLVRPATVRMRKPDRR